MPWPVQSAKPPREAQDGAPLKPMQPAPQRVDLAELVLVGLLGRRRGKRDDDAARGKPGHPNASVGYLGRQILSRQPKRSKYEY